MKRIILAGMLLAGLHLPSAAMNGRAVSAQFRHGGNTMEAGMGGGGKSWMGNIVLYTIQNNTVTKADTLHSRSQGFGQAPIFSLDGKRVAFIHWGAREAAGRLTGTADPDSITIIDIATKVETNLCKLAVHPPTTHMEVAWPAGDWVYYSTDLIKQIWRVNVASKVHEMVYSSGSGTNLWHFTLSASGSRMGMQINGSSNNIFSFLKPDLTVSVRGLFSCGSCNAAVSTSGHYEHSFGGNDPGIPHPKDNICTDGGGGRDGTPNIVPAIDQPTTVQIKQWSGTTCIINSNASDWGSEKIFCSANSDKWYNQRIWDWDGNHPAPMGGYGYYNQSYAVNWVEHQAILCQTGCNDKYTNDINGMLGNTSGQVWVDDPVKNPNGDKYEDVAGNWHVVVPGADPAPIPNAPAIPLPGTGALDRLNRSVAGLQIRTNAHSIALSFPGRFAVAVINLQGKAVAHQTALGEFAVRLKDLAPGSYVLRVRAGASTMEKTIALGL